MQSHMGNTFTELYDFKPSASLYLSLFSMLYVFSPVFYFSLLLIGRVEIPALAYGLSIFTLLCLAFYLRKHLSFKGVLFFLCLVALTHLVSYVIFDQFHDAWAYFQPVLHKLLGGFNPVYDGYMDLGRAPDAWSDNATYFPKAMAYFAAPVVAAFGGDIQWGKAYHLLLLAASISYVFHFTRKDKWKCCLWILACLNPIVLTQYTSFVIDGALSSLSLMGLFYASLFFDGKKITLEAHVIGIMALSLLFCVKTSGFAFASIILFCIFLNCFWQNVAKNRDEAWKKRSADILKAQFSLGKRLLLPVLILVAVIGFHPYLTNLRDQRHIFHPLFQSADKKDRNVTSEGLEDFAKVVYPDAKNRITRLLWSIASHTQAELYPAVLKSPLSAPVSDWISLAVPANTRAAGLGPLFFLLLLLALGAWLLYGKWSNTWLILTLLIMILVQPHAWQMRYAPFLWILPFVCLASLDISRKYLTLVPISLAFFNVLTMFVFFSITQWEVTHELSQEFSAHTGEKILLNRSIYDLRGFLARYRLKAVDYESEELLRDPRPQIGRLKNLRSQVGSEISFPGDFVLQIIEVLKEGIVTFSFMEDLPPPPDKFLLFPKDSSQAWLNMSEGLVHISIDQGADSGRWISFMNRVRFFMKMEQEQKEDWELTLKGNFYDSLKEVSRDILPVQLFVNNHRVGEWTPTAEKAEMTFRISKDILNESLKHEMRLLTLSLNIADVPNMGKRNAIIPLLGIELDGMGWKKLGVE